MKPGYETLRRGEAIFYDGKKMNRIDALSVKEPLKEGIAVVWYRNADSIMICYGENNINKGLRALNGKEHSFKIDNYKIYIKNQTYNSTNILIEGDK